LAGFEVTLPAGSGRQASLWDAAAEISRRLTRIFLRSPEGNRPVYGGLEQFQSDPYWRDLIYFHEYFHGDNGAGIGASHQTGWLRSLPSSLNKAEMEHKQIGR
jgi:hypothetical protein